MYNDLQRNRDQNGLDYLVLFTENSSHFMSRNIAMHQKVIPAYRWTYVVSVVRCPLRDDHDKEEVVELLQQHFPHIFDECGTYPLSWYEKKVSKTVIRTTLPKSSLVHVHKGASETTF